jgi:hypothetical protein
MVDPGVSGRPHSWSLLGLCSIFPYGPRESQLVPLGCDSLSPPVHLCEWTLVLPLGSHDNHRPYGHLMCVMVLRSSRGGQTLSHPQGPRCCGHSPPWGLSPRPSTLSHLCSELHSCGCHLPWPLPEALSDLLCPSLSSAGLRL